MKIAAYNYRDFDEGAYFEKFAKQYQVEIIPIRETPTVENASLAAAAWKYGMTLSPVFTFAHIPTSTADSLRLEGFVKASTVTRKTTLL